ncbi:hypothetical protein SAY87_009025 [Trapa incisa]|uniref:Uncharacterized protein n=1 Tax=Trapa incisa TaxID=236973 RepID=A0AAN7PX41_9MYRT|nr:hypothetical protein SAY87_009025 [Trapa incisa]
MGRGEEGEERRRRARELGEAAKRAVEEGGSSYKNITLMINHISDLLQGNMNLITQALAAVGCEMEVIPDPAASISIFLMIFQSVSTGSMDNSWEN